MTRFMGKTLSVRISVTDQNASSYYDPDEKRIYLNVGWAATLVRKLMGRSRQWLLGHELAHAYLDTCTSNERRVLTRAFGSLTEKAYSSNPAKEIYSLIAGYDTSKYLSARSTLCPEEDFAECCAYLYCGGSPQRYEGTLLGKKLSVLQKVLTAK